MGQRVWFDVNMGEMARRVKVDLSDFNGGFDLNMFVDWLDSSQCRLNF